MKSVCVMLALVIAFSASAMSASALATQLEAGSSMATAANIPQFDTAYVSTLSKAEEVDWFKFTTVSDDAYYSVKLVNYSLPDGGPYYSPNIFLYDANMQQIDSGHNNVVLNNKLENNATYYIKVHMGQNEKKATGNFEISVSYKYDAVPNESENAKMIKVNETYVCSLDGTADVDWFKFTTVSNDAYYSVELANLSLGGSGAYYSPNIYLYDANMQQINSGYNNVVLNNKLENNATYYIKVLMGQNEKKATGNYEISVSYKYDVAPNEMKNAKSISLNTTNICSLDGTADIDWYKFTTTRSGEYTVTMKNHDLSGYDENREVNGNYAPNIYVLDVNSQELAHKNNNITFTLELEANTTYYVKVMMGGYSTTEVGTYSVTVSNGEEPVTPNPDPDPNPGEDPDPDPGYQETRVNLTGISISSKPHKTEYVIGEEFDDSGLAIKATYSDGTSSNKVDGFEVNGFDSSEAGTCTVTVSFTDKDVTKTTTFDVEIVEGEEDNGGFLSAFLNIFVIIINFFVSLLSALV